MGHFFLHEKNSLIYQAEKKFKEEIISDNLTQPFFTFPILAFLNLT
jgi:hypothetical protein